MTARGTLTTGTARVTVAAPHRRIDVVLPEQQPIAELLPQLLSMSGESGPDAAVGGWALSRLGQPPLEASGTLLSAGVQDGEVLHLRHEDPLPEPVYDDVIDALATAVQERGGRWSTGPARLAGLAMSVGFLVLLAALLAVLPDHGELAGAAVVAGLLAVILLGVAVSLGWALADHAAAATVGCCSLPLAFVAGFDALRAGDHRGALCALAGLAVLAIFGLLGLLTLRAAFAIFLAAAVLGAVGALALLVQILFGFTVPNVAAIVCGLAFAVVALLPTWSLASVHFVTPLPEDFSKDDVAAPTGQPVDLAALRGSVRRATYTLTGLLIAAGATISGSAVLIAISPSAWGLWLVAVVSLALLFRTRAFGQWQQQAVVLATAGAGLCLADVGLVVTEQEHPAWLMLPVLGATVIALLVALVLPRRQVSPFWGQLRDVAELLLIAAVIPLALGGLGAYHLIHTLGS